MSPSRGTTLDLVPLRNRVTPLGEIIATPERGLVYGNRGCLHDAGGRIRRRCGVKRWIACRLEFRGWQRRPLLGPGRFTELFFLDEATALAAGHRPCALCRRADYDHLTALWADLHPGRRGADAIDAQLHAERLSADAERLSAGAERMSAGAERLNPRAKRLNEVGCRRRFHRAPLLQLPDGTFVLHEGDPYLVLDTELLRWSPGGYTARIPRPARERATVITPPSLVELLRTERTPLVPLLHPSATA